MQLSDTKGLNVKLTNLTEVKDIKERLAKYPFIEIKGYGFTLTDPSEWVIEFEMNRSAVEFLHRLFLEVDQIDCSFKTHGIKLGYAIRSSDTDRVIQLNIQPPQTGRERITKDDIQVYLTALIQAIDIVDMEQCKSKSELSKVQSIQSTALTAIDTLWFHRPLKHVNARSSLNNRRHHLTKLFKNKFVTVAYFNELTKTKLGYIRLIYSTPLPKVNAIVSWLSSSRATEHVSFDAYWMALAVQLKYNGYTIMPGFIDTFLPQMGQFIIDDNYPWGWDLTMTTEQHEWVQRQFGIQLDSEQVYETTRLLDKVYNPDHWKLNL